MPLRVGHGGRPRPAERLEILGVDAERDPGVDFDQPGVVERGPPLGDLGPGPFPADGALLRALCRRQGTACGCKRDDQTRLHPQNDSRRGIP